MSARSVRILLLAAAFLAGLMLCFGVILIVTGRVSAPVAQQVAAIGGPFKLVDQDGSGHRPGFQGPALPGVLRVHPLPGHLPDGAVRGVGSCARSGRDADRTRALFITVDPERDTPKVIKDYLSSFDPHLTGLTGDPAEVAAVAKAYRVYFKKGSARSGRLHRGPHRDRLPDGQGGPLRLALQSQADDGAAAADLRKHL